MQNVKPPALRTHIMMLSYMLHVKGDNQYPDTGVRSTIYEIVWSSRHPPTHDTIRSSLGVLPALRGTTIKPLSISKRSLWKDVKDVWRLHMAVVVLTAGLAIPVYAVIALWECRAPLWIITFAVYPRFRAQPDNPLFNTAQSVRQDRPPTDHPHTPELPAAGASPDAVEHW